MSHLFDVVDEESSKDLTCLICLEIFSDPVETVPCQHCYCRQCIGDIKTCPTCRGDITSTKPVNRVLINLANQVRMRCRNCGGTCTHEERSSHVCSGSSTSNAAAQSTSINSINNNLQNQQQQQQHNLAPPPSHPVPSQQQQTITTTATANSYPQPQTTDPPGPWDKYFMSQSEYDHVMCIFLSADLDGGGTLDQTELKTITAYLNYPHTPADVENMFREAGAEAYRKRELNFEQFVTWMARHRIDSRIYGLDMMTYNNVLYSFRECDRDHNGQVDITEFTQFALKNSFSHSQEEARRLFQMVDTDRSGTIDLDEFLRFKASSQSRSNQQQHQHHHHHQFAAPPQFQQPQYQHQHYQQHHHQQFQQQYPPQPAPQQQYSYPPPQQQQQQPPNLGYSGSIVDPSTSSSFPQNQQQPNINYQQNNPYGNQQQQQQQYQQHQQQNASNNQSSSTSSGGCAHQ